MKIAVIAAVAVLTGCASSPEYVARQSNYDVCRLTMGGPHSAAAEAEARGRGLDCTPLYPAIAADQASRRAAATQLLLMNRPAPAPMTPYQIQPPQQINCQSYRVGNTVETSCR